MSVSHAPADVDVLVTADAVARTFGAGARSVVAVHGATCSVRSSDRIAVMGPSGSGKSTLLHLLAGLEEPTAGTVAWPGIGVRSMLRPGPVGVVFQSPSLLPFLDAIENVRLPLLLGGCAPDEADHRSAAALDALEIGDLAARLPDELSGGQAQRVAVARALAGQPRLLLADEPTGQLDHAHGDLVITALIDAAAHAGAGLLVTTHDPTVAARMATQWTMHEGRLNTEGAPCSD